MIRKTCTKAFIVRVSAMALLVAVNVQAEIYKHVDKNGNISYSDIKPADANDKNISEISPDESKANLFDAQEQAENQEQSVDFFAKRKMLREQEAFKQKQLGQWRKELKAALLELKMAKQAKSEGVVAEEGDFIGKAGGGARPSESYFKKLEQLDANVAIAEQKVATIRRQKP